jgi:hypothetical protein
VLCLVASGIGASAYHRYQERQEEKETKRKKPAASALASVLPEECLADEIEARRLRAVKGLPPGAVIPSPPARARSGKERSSSIRSKGELGQHHGDTGTCTIYTECDERLPYYYNTHIYIYYAFVARAAMFNSNTSNVTSIVDGSAMNSIGKIAHPCHSILCGTQDRTQDRN